MDFAKLYEVVGQLPRKQRELGNLLLERPELFAFGTLGALENRLGISRITIIRFAKRLGFEGYGPLQEAVREEYLRRVGFETPRNDMDKLFEGHRLQEQTSRQHAANLDATLASLDLGTIDDICRLLLGARRILISGSGSAEVVALLLARLLRHVGLRGELVTAGDVDRIIAVNDLGERDVVVAVNLWLTFADTVRVVRLAKRLGAKTVGIVGSRASPIRTMVDHQLLAPAQGVVPRFSVLAAVAVVEILVAELASKRPKVARATAERLYDLYVQENLIAPAIPEPSEK